MSSDAPAPIARPAKQATPSELNPANSAAPSAGTISSGSVVVFSVISGATRMPNAPAMTLASSELTSDRRRGDTPAYIAYRSLSAAALVDRPNWVKRYSAHSAAPSTTAIQARIILSTGTAALNRWKTLPGSTEVGDSVLLP